MEPYKITVVIEAPTEFVGLGHAMLGGKISGLAVGDKIDVANKYEPLELVIHGKKTPGLPVRSRPAYSPTPN